MLHAPRSALPQIRKLLPGSESPTVIPLEGPGDQVAVHAVCRENVFWETLESLKARRRERRAGAAGREDAGMSASHAHPRLEVARRPPSAARRCARPAQRDAGARRERARATSSTTCARGGDAALRDYTERFDGVRLDALRGRRRGVRRGRARADAPSSSPHSTRAIDNVRASTRRRALRAAAHRDRRRACSASASAVPIARRRPVRAGGLRAAALHRHHAGGAGAPSPAARCACCARRRRRTAAPIPRCWWPHARAASSSVFKVGGAQAIAAMAYGTAAVPKVRQDLRPRQRLGHGGQADGRRTIPTAPPSTCRPVRPKCWSSPMTARARTSSPPTCSRRPSTARDAQVVAGHDRRDARRSGVAPRSQRQTTHAVARSAILARVDRRHAACIVVPTSRTALRGRQRLRARAPDPADARAARSWLRRGHAAPARCSSATGRRRPWATTAAAPITCCPPTVTHAPTAACRWRISRSASRCRN